MDRNLLVRIAPDLTQADGAALPDRAGQIMPNKLVAADGLETSVSDAAFAVLAEILPALEARRQTITILPTTSDLSPNQAADLLNVSRPYLMKLLKQGDIPYLKVGSHHRIRLDDLQQYQAQRDAQRRRSLNALTELMEEEGLFD
jgi:excisionase family DNA binding protein